MRQSTSSARAIMSRFQILFFVLIFLAVVIIGKLGYLQIVQAGEYRRLAEQQNSRGVVLPARRGSIFMQDARTAELFPVAQNSTTYTIFADPMLIPSGTERAVADALLPFLYTLPEPESDVETLMLDASNDVDEADEPSDDSVQEEASSTTPVREMTTEQLRNFIADKLATKDVVRREIWDVDPEALQLVTDARLPGVAVAGNVVTINPTLISNPDDTATKLATILDANYNNIYPLMQRRQLRYTRLAVRVEAPVKNEIMALGIRGIGSIPEYRRVYPEGSLAGQVIGFLSNQEVGVGGIEGTYERVLSGTDGMRRTQVDPFNRQITVGDILIQEATDGADVVLTIDRTIQELVERHLADIVETQRADGAQAIVMDPHTGAILALAHVPTFDPNFFGQAYLREELVKTERTRRWVDSETGEVHEEVDEIWKTARGEELVMEFEREYVVRDGWRYPVFHEGEQGELRAIYENRVGPGIFRPTSVTDPHEPGSIFKSIVLAMGLDAGVVTPETRSPYSGPVPLGEYIGNREIVIQNALRRYYGRETMTEVLGHSSNVGMTFVVEALGKATFYDYLKRFGFGERTDIDLEGENRGSFEHFNRWSRAEHVTKSFGQGITVNLVQMGAAYSALANGGLLMQPHLVSEIRYPDGRIITTEPETVRRVISPETSKTITAMLIASVDQFFADGAQVQGYYVAGKTGTSQTYSKSGRAFTQLGTTIATFAGYAPATDPKFVIIVKLDRPRVSEWGSGTSAPTFRKVTEELLRNYFAIPPKESRPALNPWTPRP